MAWLPPRCCSSRGCWLPHHQRQRSVVFGRRWLRGSLLLFIAHVMLVGVLCVVVVECSMLCVDCGDAVVPAASGAARGMYSMEPWLAALSGSRFCPLVCMVVDDRQNLAQSTCVRVVERPLCMRYIGLPHSPNVYCDGSEQFCRIFSPTIPMYSSQCSGGRKYIMLCHFETSHGKSGDSRNIF